MKAQDTQLKVTEIQNSRNSESSDNLIVPFLFILQTFAVQQEWQGSDRLSASGLSELKDEKEKECDEFCSIIFGKIMSNKHLGAQNDFSQLEVIFKPFTSFLFFCLMKLICCLGTSSPV